MDKTQEVFIRKSITEFASTNRLSLNDRDIEIDHPENIAR